MCVRRVELAGIEPASVTAPHAAFRNVDTILAPQSPATSNEVGIKHCYAEATQWT